MGASLIALGLKAHAGGTMTPAQAFEGGTNTYNNWLELSGGALFTSGNKAQAEQGTGLKRGGFGGIADLHYQTQIAKKTTLALDGRFIPANRDYKFGLGVDKDNLGFIHFSYENFRVYDSANGGYSPVDGLAFPNPGDALGLDRGQVSFEAGYNQDGKPKVTFKYTHNYRDGQEGSTIWGLPATPTSSNLRLAPSVEVINDESDTFQLDVSKQIKKTQVGAGFRYDTGKVNNADLLTSFQNQKIADQENTSYDLESVHAYTETWLKDSLFLSTGFMFENLDDTFTGSRIYGDDFDVVYSPAYPANYYGYYNLNGGAHQNEYVFNVNLMAIPAKNFTITPSLRVQQEDWNANSTEAVFDPGGTLEPNAFNNHSGYDTIDVREQLEARYTGMTNWVYSATAQWTEGQGSLNEFGGIYQSTMGGPDGPSPVQFSTDDSRLFQKYNLSARWYPTRRINVDLGGYYKNNQYNYDQTSPRSPNSAGLLYPGFLVYQGFQTWDGNTRLTLHLLNSLTLVSRYEYQLSTVDTRPESASGLAEVESSRLHSHILGQNISWMPLNWLSVQVGADYVISETTTPASSGAQSSATQSILNSQNNYWTVNGNIGLVLDDKTDLNLGYYYYRANDGQNSLVNGLPLGTDAEQNSVTATLTRRISKNIRWNLRYGFTHYVDLASAGNYNFDAHVIYSSLQYRF